MTQQPYAGTVARIDEIADGIYRIAVPVDVVPGGFTFCQFLIDDDEPLLFETGTAAMFPVVRSAIERVMPLQRLRYVSFSHGESDECGALAEILAGAPEAQVLCGRLGKMVVISDSGMGPVRVVGDGEEVALGRHRVRWYDTPHVPHCWDAGLLMETTTATLFSSDIFTQGGADPEPVTQSDILEASEPLRQKLQYYSNLAEARRHLDRLAEAQPKTSHRCTAAPGGAMGPPCSNLSAAISFLERWTGIKARPGGPPFSSVLAR